MTLNPQRLGLVPLTAGCVALAALTLLLPASHSYDPWSWIIWGREVLHLDLHTDTGPSWKPLPVLFTTPFALFGDIAPDLWMVVARAAMFGAVVAAASIGLRLAGVVGAVAAGLVVASMPLHWQTAMLGNSEGLLILCVLAAVDRHLAGKERQAFAFALGAALLRPEAWPFLGLYALWLLVRDRRALVWMVPGFAFIPLLWLLPELWGSGNLWRAAERAQAVGPNAPANADRPALAVLDNAIELAPFVANLGLLVGVAVVALGRVERSRAIAGAAVAALGAAWLLLVMLMTEGGFSGINRYLYTPVAIGQVMGGVGLAWGIAALLAAERRRGLAIAAAAVVAVVALGGVYRQAAPWEGHYRFVERHGQVTDDLDDMVARVGGPGWVERCGDLYTSFFVRPAVAWELDRHLDEIVRPARPPGSVFRARLVLSESLDPPRGFLSDRIVGRTRYWEVEAACR